jgi:hypothetical protein
MKRHDLMGVISVSVRYFSGDTTLTVLQKFLPLTINLPDEVGDAFLNIDNPYGMALIKARMLAEVIHETKQQADNDYFKIPLNYENRIAYDKAEHTGDMANDVRVELSIAIGNRNPKEDDIRLPIAYMSAVKEKVISMEVLGLDEGRTTTKQKLLGGLFDEIVAKEGHF